MNNTDFINNLKVGDKVVVVARYKKAIKEVSAVNKATIKVGEHLYNKSDGYMRGGGGYCTTHIEELTDKLAEEIEVANARETLTFRLAQISPKKLTPEQITKFNTFLDSLTSK